MIKKAAVFLFAVLFPALLCAATVNIFHTSDEHGFYFPVKKQGKTTGGYATLANLLAQEKTPYLLVSSGDFTSGTAEAKESKGMTSVEFMNKLGYKATTVGNHEGDFKEPAFHANVAAAKFDVLAVNIKDKKTGTFPPNIKPYAIYEINGKKIAFIGMAKDPELKNTSMRFTWNKKAVRKALSEAQQQNPDAIVFLVHSSIFDEKHEDSNSPAVLLKGIDGFDLVLGGHAHKILQDKIDGVYYAESGSYLEGVSKISLDFDDKSGKLNDIKIKYIPLDTVKIGEKSDIKAFAESKRNKELDTVIATAKETLYKNSPDVSKGVDSPLGNLFADMIKQKAKTDIALQNSGGIRVDIPKGEITKRLVFEVFPFPNKVVVLKVNGAFIRKLLLKTLRADSSLFQYSGLTATYKYKNNRPQDLKILIDGKALDKDKMYTLAVNDYIAEGNSEGYMFKKLKDKTSLGDAAISDLFIDYLKQNAKDVKAPPVGRLKKVS